MSESTPIQPVPRPILCSPYSVPGKHWHYDRTTGTAQIIAQRRPSRYWYKTKDDAKGQYTLELSEGQDDLHAVNQLREDIARWRDQGYPGATPVTKELLQFWKREDRPRRLFFCQVEAVETVIYLAEILRSGKKPNFKTQFPLGDMERLVDAPSNSDLLPLIRFGCKMATGSGKTVVMAMLIAWAFCNRGQNRTDERFPRAVLVCCPNLTVKERVQVLRPDYPGNYFTEFDIVPLKYRPLLQNGKVLVTNWHAFALKSEHSEGDKSYAVVNKGEESNDAFARDRLGELFDQMPIMVLNDEAHHCYRPKPLAEKVSGEEAQRIKEELEEATIWIEGLDRINNALPGRKPGIAMCVDLSATPFYLSGSGYPEGRPFPWLVSDFGLVDAIESGIVKIPRLPAIDSTGRPIPKFFKLWRWIVDGLAPGEREPGKAGKPKPHIVYREAQAGLIQLAAQWKERFEYVQQGSNGRERVPPVMIIVCDNVNIAEVFYKRISGESSIETVTEDEVGEVLEAEDQDDEGENPKPSKQKGRRPKARVVYGPSDVLQEFANTPQRKYTIRIDNRLLAEAESEDPNKTRQDAAEQLRRVVATVGKQGEPGEFVRCVVSVAMLTEGWDANNVTHILGIRAFNSQLLCEQVVGRGLRRMDYTPDPKTGLLTEEFVDVYGIPFTLIPFKGRETDQKAPEDRPKNYVCALPERKHLEIRFPVVEGYAISLRKNAIRCNVSEVEGLELEPNREPTATFVLPTVGYQEGRMAQQGPFEFVSQDRERYYRENHIQTIKFTISQLLLDRLASGGHDSTDKRKRVLALQSRHALFPAVYRIVNEYVQTKVDFRGCHPSELGLQKYVNRMVERLQPRIEPDDAAGEPPLLPVLNRYKPIGTTAEVGFKTVRQCRDTQASHINQVVLDTDTWEASTAFMLEKLALDGVIHSYARNDHLGFTIPYEYQDLDHGYEPDFLVRFLEGPILILETKGFIDDQTRAKHNAAGRWVSAVNNWTTVDDRAGGNKWAFHVNADPQKLVGELLHFVK